MGPKFKYQRGAVKLHRLSFFQKKKKIPQNQKKKEKKTNFQILAGLQFIYISN